VACCACAAGCCAWVCCACGCGCEGVGTEAPREGIGPRDGSGPPRLGSGEAGVFLTGRLLCVLCGATSFALSSPVPSTENSLVNPSTKTNFSCCANRPKSIPAPLLASVFQNSKSRSHDTRTTMFSSSFVSSVSVDGAKVKEETKALRKSLVTSQWGVESSTPVRRS
jgi:hypothetical protein